MQTVALFVHGAGGGGWEWVIWRRVFAAAGWRCATPDLVPATAGLARTGWHDYLAQTLAAARSPPNGAAPCVLIGASLGGLLAWAATSQVEVRALVLVNPLLPDALLRALAAESDATGRDVEADEALAARATDDVLPWARRRALASTLRAMPDADDAARLFAFRRWRDESALVLREARALALPPTPACPELVVASELDSDVSPALSKAFALSRGAALHTVAGASHVGPLLGAAAPVVASWVVEWLSGGGRMA